MRSRAGASSVDIDMVAQVVHYVLDTPYAIDYDAIQDAVRAAGYELTSLRLDTHGTVSSRRCDTCAADVPVVKLPGTDQIIEISGDVEPGAQRVAGKVSGWEGEHPVLEMGVSSPQR